MQQGSSGSALAARTAGMTDEQILDLDLGALEATAAGSPAQDSGAPWATASSEMAAGGERGSNSLAPHRKPPDDMDILDETSLGPESAVLSSAFPGSKTGAAGLASPAATSSTVTPNAKDEPAWLKQLEAQPQAAVEARQWREAAQNVAALDAAYFSGDASARSGLASRLYDSDPGAFREMLAAGARMLSERDPQALVEMARQLGMNETQAANAPAKSLAQAARSLESNAAAQNQIPGNSTSGAFPADAYRTFESATNEDIARATRQAIDRTLSSTLPEGIGDGARRRIGDDIFQELHATLSGDRELSRQVGEILRGWQFDGAARQQVASLISNRARAAMPEVARRVIGEWTTSVLASDRARAARVDAAASRRDISGGRLPATVPTNALLPKKIDYSKMSDEQILDL